VNSFVAVMVGIWLCVILVGIKLIFSFGDIDLLSGPLLANLLRVSCVGDQLLQNLLGVGS